MLNKREVREIFTKIKTFTLLDPEEDIAELEKDIAKITSSHIEALDKLDEKIYIHLPWDIEPKKFHRYRSSVRERFFEMDLNSETEKLRAELISLFNHVGIEAYDSNKIVLECEINGKRVCYGFYDGKFSIGFSYHDDNEKTGG